MHAVLVLDDDLHIAELIRVVLDDAGYEVHVATSEHDIPQRSFDCVVTDLMSLSVYRFEDARGWILSIGDRFPRVPVIVTTAHPQAREDADALGARSVIMKPFDVEQIIAAVREVTGS